MSEHAIEPVPQPAQGEPVPTAYSMQQVTQTTFNTAIPSHVWTSAVLSDLHAKQHDISIKQLELEAKRAGMFNEHRLREHRLGWAAFALVSAIILVSLFLVVGGDAARAAVGTHIIASAIAFLAGYLAGHGQGQSERR